MAKLLHRIVIFLLPPTLWYGFSNQLHKKVALKSRVFRVAVSRFMLHNAMSSWLLSYFLRLCLWSLLVIPSLSSLLLQTGILIFFSAYTAFVLSLPWRCFRTILPVSKTVAFTCFHAPHGLGHTVPAWGGVACSLLQVLQGYSSLCILSARPQELRNIFRTKWTIWHINVLRFYKLSQSLSYDLEIWTLEPMDRWLFLL